MKTLQALCEGILDTDLGNKLDTKLLGKLGQFIDVLKSTNLDHNKQDQYTSRDKKLSDAADDVAYYSKFKIISKHDAQSMIKNNDPRTILVVDLDKPGYYEWKLVDPAVGEYIRVTCVSNHEPPVVIIDIEKLTPDKRYDMSKPNFVRYFEFPVGTYDYYKKAITKQ